MNAELNEIRKAESAVVTRATPDDELNDQQMCVVHYKLRPVFKTNYTPHMQFVVAIHIIP